MTVGKTTVEPFTDKQKLNKALYTIESAQTENRRLFKLLDKQHENLYNTYMGYSSEYNNLLVQYKDPKITDEKKYSIKSMMDEKKKQMDETSAKMRILESDLDNAITLQRQLNEAHSSVQQKIKGIENKEKE